MTVSELPDSYIATLKEKYRSAVRDEKDALDALAHARRRKEVYATTLEEEGVDAKMLDTLFAVTHRKFYGGTYIIDKPLPAENGQKIAPLSDTHAVYLIMRKHGNTGFSFGELKKYADQEGYNLSEDVIRRVFWKQQTEERMERMPDGRIRLTKEGETFNRFRVQKMEK